MNMQECFLGSAQWDEKGESARSYRNRSLGFGELVRLDLPYVKEYEVERKRLQHGNCRPAIGVVST